VGLRKVNIMVGSGEWSRAVHLVVNSKQRDVEKKGQKTKDVLQRPPLVTCFLHPGPYLLKFPSTSPNSSTDGGT
jgi:hypothetical protein